MAFVKILKNKSMQKFYRFMICSVPENDQILWLMYLVYATIAP